MEAEGITGFILQPGDGRSIDLGDFQMTVKATSEESRRSVFTSRSRGTPRVWATSSHPSRRGGGLLRPRRGVHHLSRGTRGLLCRRNFHLHPGWDSTRDFALARCKVGSSISTFQPRWLGTSMSSAPPLRTRKPTRKRCPTSRCVIRWKCSGRCQRATSSEPTGWFSVALSFSGRGMARMTNPPLIPH